MKRTVVTRPTPNQSPAVPLIARWDVLSSLLKSARAECTVFTPFYSSNGLALVESCLDRSVSITIWTRLSLRDWATGASDPEALSGLLQRLESAGRTCTLFVNRSLHAKAYFADAAAALVGSANLTDGGFQSNIELVVRIDGDSARCALGLLTVACSSRAVAVPLADLTSWVLSNRKLIRKARSDIKKGLRALDSAQAEADSLVGESPLVEPTHELLNEFVQWMGLNRNLPGAVHLLELHKDRVVQRQQGHVKQCFAGAYRFLQEHPSWIQKLTQAAEAGAGMFDPGGALLRDWSFHLQAHATAANELYSYATLRAVLPRSRGGSHRTGGGASATLRRILPLVASFITSRSARPPKSGT